MSVEKRDGQWFNGDLGPFDSRDAARAASKIESQEAAMDTYAENLAATEALDAAEDTEADSLVADVAEEFPQVEGFAHEEQELTDGSVTRETVKDVRKRENYVTMALYANTAPARAYWRKLAEAEGYEVPAEVSEDATV